MCRRQNKKTKVLYRMARRAVTLESLIVPLVGFGKMSGLWMTTELWMIKVQMLYWIKSAACRCVVLKRASTPRLGVWRYYSPR